MAALATLAAALSVAYQLHAEAASQAGPLRPLDTSRALRAVRRAREARWPRQGLALLQEELLLGAGSCAPHFAGACLRRQGRYRPEALGALLDALGDALARGAEHARAREVHQAALGVKLERRAAAEELAAAYAALAADEMTLKLNKLRICTYVSI